jgi:dTMP kinase
VRGADIAKDTSGGLFLVLEGVEGAGKSTQSRRLSAWCESAGVKAVFTREPGGTALGEQIRRLLLEGGDVPPRSELLLLLAARAALVDEVIRPALEAGQVVCADRYELSTLAYQGYGRDLALREVRALNAFATGGLRPDLTIVLDLPPVVGRERKESAAAGVDRIEREADTFHARVAEGYRTLAQNEPAVVCIDASGAADAVEQAILDVLRQRFPETFPNRVG